MAESDPEVIMENLQAISKGEFNVTKVIYFISFSCNFST